MDHVHVGGRDIKAAMSETLANATIGQQTERDRRSNTLDIGRTTPERLISTGSGCSIQLRYGRSTIFAGVGQTVKISSSGALLGVQDSFRVDDLLEAGSVD